MLHCTGFLHSVFSQMLLHMFGKWPFKNTTFVHLHSLSFMMTATLSHTHPVTHSSLLTQYYSIYISFIHNFTHFTSICTSDYIHAYSDTTIITFKIFPYFACSNNSFWRRIPSSPSSELLIDFNETLGLKMNILIPSVVD